MKKIIQLLTVMCIMVFGTQFAFAWEVGTSKETVYSYGMLDAKSFVIGNPQFSPQDEEPTVEELTKMIYDQAVKNNKKNQFSYMSYQDFCRTVNNKEHIDIYRLGRHKALELFKERVKDYGDAYIVCTVSNDTRLNVFFDVVDSKSHEVLYSYRKLAPKGTPRDTKLYEEICRDFFNAYSNRIKVVAREKKEEDELILKMGKENYEKYKKEKLAKQKAQEIVENDLDRYLRPDHRVGRGWSNE